MIGGDHGVPIDLLIRQGAPIVHVCGVIDHEVVATSGLLVNPAGRYRPGFMKATTAYVGPRPVIDLHAGGLKVGELLVRGLRETGSAEEAIRRAVEHGIALEDRARCGCCGGA